MTEDNQKLVRTVLIIIVVLIAGYFLYQKSSFLKKESKPQEIILKNIVTPQVSKIVENNLQKEMPAGFPKDVPLNGKTKIINSYSAAYPNSTAKQSTISFESSKTAKQNYDFYLKFAKDNKWEIKNTSKQENLMSLYGQKNKATLNITIIQKTSDKTKSEMNITYGEI